MVTWRSVVFEVFLWWRSNLHYLCCQWSAMYLHHVLRKIISNWVCTGRTTQSPSTQTQTQKAGDQVSEAVFCVRGKNLKLWWWFSFPSHNDCTGNTCIWLDKITYSPCQILFSWETLARVLDGKTRPRRMVELDLWIADKPHDASN